MKAIGTPTNSGDAAVQEADTLLKSGDRTEPTLQRMQSLHDSATGEAKQQIANLIEAFLVDGGIQL